MQPKSPGSLRISAMARPLTWLAIAFVRLFPIVTLAIRSRGESVTLWDWSLAFGAVVALLLAFELAARRCTSPDLAYHRGLIYVGASLSTGWTLLDPILVFTGVVAAQLISCVLALTKDPASRYLRLIRWFYRHRMEQ